MHCDIVAVDLEFIKSEEGRKRLQNLRKFSCEPRVRESQRVGRSRQKAIFTYYRSDFRRSSGYYRVAILYALAHSSGGSFPSLNNDGRI